MAGMIPDDGSVSPEVLELLRGRAVQADLLGYAIADIAAVLGVPEETISQWCSQGRAARSSLLSGGAGSSASPVPFNTASEAVKQETLLPTRCELLHDALDEELRAKSYGDSRRGAGRR
jgi:hypothetical protein